MDFSRIFRQVKWIWQNRLQLKNFAAKMYYTEITQKDVILNSEYFDEAYYLRNNPEISDCEDPVKHYLMEGGRNRKDPSEFFCSEEYLAIHADVAVTDLNPLLQYEMYGRNADYEISTLQLRDDGLFPEGTESFERIYAPNPSVHKRTAVISCFFTDGHIPKTLLFLLRGTKEIADNIILVGDCPVFPSEMEKLNGLVCYAKFSRHYQYDFGSYKEGMQYARKAGLMDSGLTEELIFINDSCFGPIYPFSEAFDRMKEDLCDFWGFTGYQHDNNRIFKSHICSYFIVFRRPVINSNYLDEFLNRVDGKFDRGKVIVLLETEMTEFLQLRGFLWQTLCDDLTIDNFINPLTIVKKYRIPLVKKKSFSKNLEEDLNEVLEIIRMNAPELAQLVQIKPSAPRFFRLPSIREHQDSLPGKAERIRKQYKTGRPVRVLFLTDSYTSFSAGPLCEKMLRDPAFDVFLTIIPDLCLERDGLQNVLYQEKRAIRKEFPEERLLKVRPDGLGCWPDVCESMDIVCYNTPKNTTTYRYCPKYAAGRNFLPVIVNDRISETGMNVDLLRLDAYRYMWKVFFMCDDDIQRYQAVCIDGNRNAELAALIPMEEDANRKCENICSDTFDIILNSIKSALEMVD